jgi:hypothetical protein
VKQFIYNKWITKISTEKRSIASSPVFHHQDQLKTMRKDEHQWTIIPTDVTSVGVTLAPLEEKLWDVVF